MKIVSMERTAAEKKAAEERYKVMPSDGPDYPYGLCLNLGSDELAKLGVKKLPAVGDEIHIVAVCKVTNRSESESDRGDDSKSVSLQITKMGVEPEAEEPTGFQKKAKSLYKSAEKSEGEA